MKNRIFLALLAPVATVVLLFAGCPSPNNAAVVTTPANTSTSVAAAPNQPVTTGVPAAAETGSTPAKTPAQVSAPPPTTPFETIFIPDCCSTDTAPPTT